MCTMLENNRWFNDYYKKKLMIKTKRRYCQKRMCDNFNRHIKRLYCAALCGCTVETEEEEESFLFGHDKFKLRYDRIALILSLAT